MHRPRIGRLVLMLWLPAYLSGCYTWQRSDMAASSAPATANSGAVRVTLVDGSTLQLSEPRISGDSLVGETGKPPRWLSIPLVEVGSIQERRLSGGRTAAAALGVAAGTALVVLVVIGASQGFGIPAY